LNSSKGLVLIGHGSKLPYYIEVMELHKSRIEKLGIFNEVKIAYVSVEPHVDEVVRKMKSKRIYLVPLFISHGVHIEDIPKALGFSNKTSGIAVASGEFEGKQILICKPIGKDPLVTYAILNSVLEVLE
jgi:sirohydrochlorin ferrochelatase